MKVLSISSPAKINLYLKVIRRRPDGYHELVTLFQRISLKDTLRLKKIKTGFEFRCSDKTLAAGEDNLVTKAYRLLQKSYPKLGGVSVYLKKNIPIGAGLGGGSSNAASMLLGMKKLYALKISDGALEKMGRKLGADVPFFIRNTPRALGLGRGDRIHNMKSRRKLTFLLFPSEQPLSTKSVYQELRGPFTADSLTKIQRTVTLLATLLEGKRFHPISKLLRNDLEGPAFRLRPSLRAKLDNLAKEKNVIAARLTGSGPTLFAILSGARAAKVLAQKLRRNQSKDKIIICHSY